MQVRCAIGAYHNLREAGTGTEAQFVLELVRPFVQPHVDAVVQASIRDGTVRRHVRPPCRRVVAEVEVVVSRPLSLTQDHSGGRGAFEAQRGRRFGVCGRPERQRPLLDDCCRRSPPREEPDPALPLPLILDELDAATRLGGSLTRLRIELDRADQTQCGEKTHKTRASHRGPP